MLVGKSKFMLEFLGEQICEKSKEDHGDWMDESMGVQLEKAEGAHVRMEWEERESTTIWKANTMGEEERSMNSSVEGSMEEAT